jgi:hypothetical protein
MSNREAIAIDNDSPLIADGVRDSDSPLIADGVRA